jgi:anti-sigma factor RsiW
MKCEKQYNYFEYLEGTLSDIERESFEKHLKGCIRCQHNLKTVQGFLKEIENERQVTVLSGFQERVMQKLEKNKKDEQLFKRWQPAVIGILSLLAIVVGINLGNYYYNKVISSKYSSYLNFNESHQEIIELSLLGND